MNTLNKVKKLPFLTISALSALGLMLVACGEGEQQDTEPTTEQQSESSSQ